jgi:hypothetical protein
MKRLRIMKSYAVLWLFIYFLVYSNIATIKVFFFATLTFNLAVLTILTIGIIMLLKASLNLVMLAGTFGTLAYKKDNLLFYLEGIDKIMPANIAHMFNSRAEKGVMLFTAEESRDVIEWIEDKFFNQNRYTNYFIGTALMIGLLGTFTGLLVAIDDMGRIILSLSGDINLARVISDFSGPLGGMAVGFGSSLFGVVAAIILGIKGYILNRNQETLIEGIEDWLKGRIIAVGSTAPATDGMGGSELPDQQHSFIDVFIEQISAMTSEMAKISNTNERLHSITIASVQQARNEHELTISIMESMKDSLQSIDTQSQENIKTLTSQLEALSSNISTSQDKAAQRYIQDLDKLFTRLDDSLQTAKTTISEDFSRISLEQATLTSSHIDKVTSTLANIDSHLEHNKHSLDKLLNTSSHDAQAQEAQLKQISTLLHTSSQTLLQEKSVLNSLHQQLQTNDSNSSEHMKSIMTSLFKLAESLDTEIQQLVNMEDIQRSQGSSLQQNILLLSQMKEALEKTKEGTSTTVNELQDIKNSLELMASQSHEDNKQGTSDLAAQIQNLRQLMQKGQEQYAEALSKHTLQNEISVEGNNILREILNDQKAQMRALAHSQEKMLIEQTNLATLSKEGLAKGNENLEKLQQQAVSALEEQQGFREEHRMLLTLTQRSSDLSEEAAKMNIDKGDENLEALERLINENQQIKTEILALSDVIKKKSFGDGNNDGFISKLFK